MGYCGKPFRVRGSQLLAERGGGGLEGKYFALAKPMVILVRFTESFLEALAIFFVPFHLFYICDGKRCKNAEKGDFY